MKPNRPERDWQTKGEESFQKQQQLDRRPDLIKTKNTPVSVQYSSNIGISISIVVVAEADEVEIIVDLEIMRDLREGSPVIIVVGMDI